MNQNPYKYISGVLNWNRSCLLKMLVLSRTTEHIYKSLRWPGIGSFLFPSQSFIIYMCEVVCKQVIRCPVVFLCLCRKQIVLIC